MPLEDPLVIYVNTLRTQPSIFLPQPVGPNSTAQLASPLQASKSLSVRLHPKLSQEGLDADAIMLVADRVQ